MFCTYLCMYVCMYTCMPVFMYAFMYVKSQLLFGTIIIAAICVHKNNSLSWSHRNKKNFENRFTKFVNLLKTF
jgi:hypothetical protein